MSNLRYRQGKDRLRLPQPRISRYRDAAAEVVPSVGIYALNPKVSFAIMAHPKRADWVAELHASIPEATVVWDQINDRHDTGLRAIKAHAVDADWHVVVQDDVILPEKFVPAVTEALRWVEPGSPACFYYGGKGSGHSHHVAAWSQAKKAGASWLARKGPIWGPAIAYPVATVENLVKYFEGSDVQNYDRRVMKFYQSVGVDCWYSIPSLVEHRQEGNPSLCGHDRGLRQAREFVGPRPAIEVDWSGPVARSRR